MWFNELLGFVGNFDNSRDCSSCIRVSLTLVVVGFLVLNVGCRRATVTETPGFRWDEPTLIATGEGVRGPWRMNRSLFLYVDDPNVHLLEDGRADVVWVDQANKDVYFRRYDPGGTPRLESPTNVSGTPGVFSWFPEVVTDPEDPDRIYVLWQEIVFSGGSHGGEIYFSRSTDGGRSFSDPLNLSQSKAGDGKGRLTEDRWDNGSLDLELGPEGDVYAVWTEYQGRLWLARSTDAGRTFGTPHLIAGGGSEPPARGPSLDVGPDGKLHLAWTVGVRSSADVHYQVLGPSGRAFTGVRRPHPSDRHADAPKLALDAEARVHLVYGSSPAGPGGNYRIHYSQKPPGSSAFTAPRVLGDTDSTRVTSRNFPSLALDGSGNPYVVWESFRSNPRHPALLEFTHSKTGGRTFGDASVIPGTPAPDGGFIGSLQGHLMGRLSVNDKGEVAVATSSFVPGESSQVRLIRGSPRK